MVEAEQFLAEIEETVANDFGREDWLSDVYDAESTAEKVVSRAEHNEPFAVKDVVAPEILSLPTDDRLTVTVGALRGMSPICTLYIGTKRCLGRREDHPLRRCG